LISETNANIAIGNVVGSNICNILLVLGLSAVVNPLTTGNEIVIDLIVMMASALLLFGISLTKNQIEKSELFS